MILNIISTIILGLLALVLFMVSGKATAEGEEQIVWASFIIALLLGFVIFTLWAV